MLGADKLASTYDFFKVAGEMAMEGLADNIKCPVFVGDFQQDTLCSRANRRSWRRRRVKRAHFKLFRNEDGAGAHCQVGAMQYLSQAIFDCFEKVIV